MAGEEIAAVILLYDIYGVILGLYAAFVGAVLRDFDEIIFYVVSRSAGEGGFFDYVKSAVLSQQCTIMEFGKLFHYKVVHEGQSVILNFVSHLREEKPGSFSLNRILDVFRNLNSINLLYGIVCIAWGATSRTVPGLIPGGVTGYFFLDSPRRNHVP